MLSKLYYIFSCSLVRLISWIYFPVAVKGRENIPKDGAFILASNHISNLDPVVAAISCPRQVKFMAKDSLFKNPILGSIIRWGGGFPVKRGSADRQAMKTALTYLKNGWPLILFPQGTRYGKKAQPGVGFLIDKSEVPVVPVFIQDTDKALPKGGGFFKRHPVKISFGKPVVFSSHSDHQTLANEVKAAFESLGKIA